MNFFVVNLLKTSEEMRKIILLEEKSQPHLSQIQNQQEKKKGKNEGGLSNLMA